MTHRQNQQFILGCIFLLANKLQLLGDRVTEELTLKQWFLLNIMLHMENKKPNYNDISKAVGSSRQNVSKMISTLQKKGMVELHQSRTDQRAIFVSLTKKCLDYLNSKDNTGNILLDELFSGTSGAEAEHAALLLSKILHNAEICLREKED